MHPFGDRISPPRAGDAVRRAIAKYQLFSPDPFVIHRSIRRRGKVVDFEFEYCNPATSQLFGCTLKELRGASLLKTFPHFAHDPNLFDRYVFVLETGEYEEAEVPHPLGIQQRTLRRRLAGLYDQRIAVCFHDISGELIERNQLALVAQALEHRLEGQFALIQALCNHALSHSATLADFKTDFPRRIAALASTGILLQSESGQICLRDLLERVLQPFNRRPFSLDGDATVAVSSSAVLALTLALHELAANGLEHRAGAGEAGRVDVRWRVEGEDMQIHWIEQVPLQTADDMPERGLGLPLIRSAVESLRGGQFRSMQTTDCIHHFIEFELLP